MTNSFYEAGLQDLSGLTSSSFPYREKSDRLKLWGSHTTGESCHSVTSQDKQTKNLCSVRSSGCVNQGSFVASLAGWCWLTAGSAGLSIQLVEQRQSQRPQCCKEGTESKSPWCFLATIWSVLEKQASKWLLPQPHTEEFINSKYRRIYKQKSPDGKDLKSLGGQQGKE